VRLFDAKFRRYPGHYFIQSFLAALVIMMAVLLMDAVAHTALIASLGATAFIAFTMPHLQVARPRFLIGGYVMGTLSGVCFGLLHGSKWLAGWGVSPVAAEVVLGGFAVGLAILLMLITDTEHPPAAGIALGLVISHDWGFPTLAVILGCVVMLCAVKHVLRRYLIDLL